MIGVPLVGLTKQTHARLHQPYDTFRLQWSARDRSYALAVRWGDAPEKSPVSVSIRRGVVYCLCSFTCLMMPQSFSLHPFSKYNHTDTVNLQNTRDGGELSLQENIIRETQQPQIEMGRFAKANVLVFSWQNAIIIMNKKHNRVQ